MHLGPERTAEFIRQVLAEGTYVICDIHWATPLSGLAVSTTERRRVGSSAVAVRWGNPDATALSRSWHRRAGCSVVGAAATGRVDERCGRCCGKRRL